MTTSYQPFSDPEDNQAITQWIEQYKGQSTQAEVNQYLGEIAGEKVRSEQLGREIILNSGDKSVAQGVDGVERDLNTDEIVVVEDKGGRFARESHLQKDEMHLIRQSEIALHGDKYHTNKISEVEIGAAREVMQAHESGNLRYEVYQTTIENGQVVTNLTRETRPNGEISANFADRSDRSHEIAESPEDLLTRRETAIAEAEKALESGNLSFKKEQEVCDLLGEVTLDRQENQSQLTENRWGEASSIPFQSSQETTSQSVKGYPCESEDLIESREQLY